MSLLQIYGILMKNDFYAYNVRNKPESDFVKALLNCEHSLERHAHSAFLLVRTQYFLEIEYL